MNGYQVIGSQHNLLMQAAENQQMPLDSHTNGKTTALTKVIDIAASAYGDKGVRKQMEDEHLIINSLRAVNSNLSNEKDISIYAIMDGHGGRHCATFVKEHLANELASQLLSVEEVTPLPYDDRTMRSIIVAAFTKLDSRIATELSFCKDGCTIVLVIVHFEMVYIASLGDSSAFLCRKLSDGNLHLIPLTETHKPWVIKEKERILKFGGMIENGRVNGMLEITRSFGDISLKRYGILCTPTFRKFKLKPESDNFILLGCDGFWNCLTTIETLAKSSEYCNREMVRAHAEKSPFNPKTVCKNLVEHVIIDKKSQDNVSVLLVKFFDKS